MVVAVNDAYSIASDELKSEASEAFEFVTKENYCNKATPPSKATISKIETALISDTAASTTAMAKAMLEIEPVETSGTNAHGNIAAIKSCSLYTRCLFFFYWEPLFSIIIAIIQIRL